MRIVGFFVKLASLPAVTFIARHDEQWSSPREWWASSLATASTYPRLASCFWQLA